MMAKSDINKVQELVYELNVGSAMTTNVITISPHVRMVELRDILRSNKISGVPVVKDGKIIGIVSLEDFIKWLADDRRDCTAADIMTRKVVTVFSDEPLVHVVGKIDGDGFGRLPVIDRRTGNLVGIITKGDLIEKLLLKLEVDYQEEEIRHYRASHFFEDIIADSTRLNFRYRIKGKSIADGGEVASSLKKTLKRLGIHPAVVRKASIAMYEAEMNVIIYAKEGEVRVTVDPSEIHAEIEDSGPGIPDTEKAMEAGYSTAPEWVRELGFGAGMGLQNIKSCSESMDLSSAVGSGTLIKISFNMVRE